MNTQICRNISLLSASIYASLYERLVRDAYVQVSKLTSADKTLKVVNVTYTAP